MRLEREEPCERGECRERRALRSLERESLEIETLVRGECRQRRALRESLEIKTTARTQAESREHAGCEHVT